MIRTVLFVFTAEIWNTAGQLLFKQSTNALPPMQGSDWRSYADFLKAVMRRPGILLGLLSMALGLVFWLVALSQAALSVVFVLGSMQYILILVASRFFLGEKIDGVRFLGTLFISIGITLVATIPVGNRPEKAFFKGVPGDGFKIVRTDYFSADFLFRDHGLRLCRGKRSGPLRPGLYGASHLKIA